MVMKVYALGDGVISQVLEKFGKEDQHKIVEMWADPTNLGVNNVIIMHLADLMLGIVRDESTSADVIEHVRVQTVALMSLLESINMHGNLFANEQHSLQIGTAQTETDGGL